LNSNSIKNKWDASWWRKYSKSSCDFGVGKENLKNTQIQKDTFPWLFSWD
jgi:hypothetical protein